MYAQIFQINGQKLRGVVEMCFNFGYKIKTDAGTLLVLNTLCDTAGR